MQKKLQFCWLDGFRNWAVFRQTKIITCKVTNFRSQNRFFSFVKVLQLFCHIRIEIWAKIFLFLHFQLFCHFFLQSVIFGLIFLLDLKIQTICLKSMPNKIDYVLSISRKVQNEVWSNNQNHKNHLLLRKSLFSLFWKFTYNFWNFFDRGCLIWVWQRFWIQN